LLLQGSPSLLAIVLPKIQQTEEGEHTQGIEPIQPDDDAQDATAYNEGIP